MIKIDNNGLILCDIQSELFEESLSLKCSTEVFIRRFMNSKVVGMFDKGQILEDTLTIKDIFDCLDDEYGVSSYGKIKYNKNELYWIGHFYRYFSYTYNLSSKQVYKLIKPKELRILYKAYHTFDTKFAIERILETKKINLNIDYNEKGLELLRKKINNQNTYYVNLSDEELKTIKENGNDIEFQINNGNAIKLNDVLIYKNEVNEEVFKARVVDMYLYKSFEELYNEHHKLTKEHEQKLYELLNKYSKEELNQQGILTIKVEGIGRFQKSLFNN
ncbi:MAG: hypothetical protein IJX78_00955 [Bacilli bacterium]|nr:hypothetical protein [Bacilli bacterium]